MKNTKNRWLNTLTSLGLAFIGLSSCSEAELDHPFNPSSDQFIGEDYAKDSDGDGLADIYGIYEEGCGKDLDCILTAAVDDGIIKEPSSVLASSSNSKSSSSSFKPLDGIDVFTVTIEGGVLKGTEITQGEFPANARLEIESSGITLGKCFNGWKTTEGNVSDPTASEIIYRVPIEPESNSIVITGSLIDCDIGDAFIDSRDGQVYDFVEVGGKTWMKTNLNYAASGSYCNEIADPDCSLYGRMYDWATASGTGSNTSGGSVVGEQGICPSGWHLPSKSELDQLTQSVNLALGGYGSANGGSPAFFELIDGKAGGRYWTSQVGAATKDAGVARNFCNEASGSCATGYAYNPSSLPENGWHLYAAEEKKTNLFNVRCLKD